MYRQPQWSQGANRDTRLTDPVVTIQQLAWFRALRNTRIDYALVFTTAQGGLETYLPPNRPSRNDLATRGWTSVYEVDTGVHDASDVLRLPSDNDAFRFDVVLECSWQVTSPAAFVASGERDVIALIRRSVDDAVRPVLRQYPMTDSAGAEQAAQRALEQAGPIGASAGLQIRYGLQIRQDEESQQHAQEIRQLEFARRKLVPEHALRMEAAELETIHALTVDRQRHQVELQRQEQDHHRQLAGARQELERHELEAKKIEYYSYWLAQGGPAAMAFHLARHPEDARLVMDNLRQDQLQLMQNQLSMAMQALGGGPGGLEEHQLDEPRRLAASVIREVLSAKLTSGGSPAGSGRTAHSGRTADGPGTGPPRRNTAVRPADPHPAAQPMSTAHDAGTIPDPRLPALELRRAESLLADLRQESARIDTKGSVLVGAQGIAGAALVGILTSLVDISSIVAGTYWWLRVGIVLFAAALVLLPGSLLIG
ncbi:SPFH domain-containing protein [Kitasatospora setae]|nr:SPFH domain-containing protein [Kitasatospora setae]